MVAQIWCLPASFVLGRALPAILCGRKLPLQLLPWSQSIHFHLVSPCYLSSCYPKAWGQSNQIPVSLCFKRSCPFKRKTGTLAYFSLTQPQYTLVVQHVSFSIIGSLNLVDWNFGIYLYIRKVSDSFQLSTLKTLWDSIEIWISHLSIATKLMCTFVWFLPYFVHDLPCFFLCLVNGQRCFYSV